jgi:hypothetical protein
MLQHQVWMQTWCTSYNLVSWQDHAGMGYSYWPTYIFAFYLKQFSGANLWKEQTKQQTILTSLPHLNQTHSFPCVHWLEQIGLLVKGNGWYTIALALDSLSIQCPSKYFMSVAGAIKVMGSTVCNAGCGPLPWEWSLGGWIGFAWGSCHKTAVGVSCEPNLHWCTCWYCQEIPMCGSWNKDPHKVIAFGRVDLRWARRRLIGIVNDYCF